jgi:23S rRNA (cytidine1920-2'-O)/16S rRNA (cytidine1409-2'-O)-methyltransferase
VRADQLLLERGLATSRSQAQRLIGAGVRWQSSIAETAPWKTIAKNSDELPEDARIELLDTAEARYVSRGGLKLEGALVQSGIDVTGAICLDVGQSTGGFTDCLLQRGAAQVVGLDVGHGQLHANMRNDPRVVAIESVNARAVTAESLIAAYDDATEDDGEAPVEGEREFDAQFDLIVADLSFISLTLVLPALVPLAKAGCAFLMLVKPQFELQPGQVGKGGIVKDPARHAEVEQRVRECCTSLGLKVLGWYDSVITGGDGNREFFVYARTS